VEEKDRSAELSSFITGVLRALRAFGRFNVTRKM
jgi:hypothetical protein